MSKPLSRDVPNSPAPGGSKSLARIIDDVQLVRVVPHLAPETLNQIIKHYGLDACGELVAAATPAQLRAVLDVDLWRGPLPGHDEQFDAERFGEWLETLADSDPAVAARVIAGMDEGVAITGLSHYIRVIDPGTLEPVMQSDDEPFEPSLARSNASECEVGGYLVRAKRPDAWDAVVSLLVALEADHAETFHGVMAGCRHLSNSAPEIDGLDNLLTDPEQLLFEIASGREQRRAHQGYSTAADARAFLEMARQPRTNAADGVADVNPIVAASFRAVDDAMASPAVTDFSAAEPGVPETVVAFLDRLADAGVVPPASSPRALLQAAIPQRSRHTRIQLLMEGVRHIDMAVYLDRTRELAFLANALLAGCPVQSRSFEPQEATDAAVSICNLGLEQWPAGWPRATDEAAACDAGGPAFLVTHDLLTAFEAGWSTLHRDVCLFAVERLLVALAGLEVVDVHVQRDLGRLETALVKHRNAGTPWLAREALDVIAVLDTPAWIGLLGLLAECPVIPDALSATVERRSGAVSATGFEFIATLDQIAVVRTFLARLPELLRE